MKYYNYQVTMSEIPDEITLCINLTNCPIHCKECHSKFLWEDVGVELTDVELYRILNKNPGITCVCFMGGDADYQGLEALIRYTEQWLTIFNKKLCVAVYSGRNSVQDLIDHGGKYITTISYLKVGPFIKELGGLDKKTTNQRLYRMNIIDAPILAKYTLPSGELYNITGVDYTYKFWEKQD